VWVCTSFLKEIWLTILVSDSRSVILIGQFVGSELIAQRIVSRRNRTVIQAIMVQRTRIEYLARCANT
jgi:hypothetical protein